MSLGGWFTNNDHGMGECVAVGLILHFIFTRATQVDIDTYGTTIANATNRRDTARLASDVAVK